MHPNRKENTMKLFTQTELDQLLENGKPENHGKDHLPVACIFLNGTGGTLVITELRTTKPFYAYGLCDLSADCCKLMHFDLDKLIVMATENGYEAKRDPNFTPTHPVSVFAKSAKRRRVVSLMEHVLNLSDNAQG